MNLYSMAIVFVPIALLIFLFFLAYRSFKKNGLTFKFTGFLFLIITHFLGYLSVFSRGSKSEEYIPSDMILGLSVLSFIGVIVFYISSHALAKPSDSQIIFAERKFNGSSKAFIFIALSVCSLSMLFYYALNGVAFNDSDYALRLNENAGNGVFIMLMTSFVPAVIVYSLTSNSRMVFFYGCVISLVFGTGYYLLMGGSRNVMLSAIFMVFMISLYRKKISKKTAIIFTLCGVALIGILSIVRYSDVSIDHSSDSYMLVFNYFIDSVSPINFQAIALKHFLNDGDVGGVYYFFSQFSGFIPRSIWPDKPIVTMNSSYYFTYYILNLRNGLNMASTMLGSSLSIFGVYFYWIVYLLAGVTCRLLDIVISKSKIGVFQIVCFMSLPFSFFMARESLEFFLFILVKNTITVSVLYVIYVFIYYPLKKVSNQHRK